MGSVRTPVLAPRVLLRAAGRCCSNAIVSVALVAVGVRPTCAQASTVGVMASVPPVRVSALMAGWVIVVRLIRARMLIVVGMDNVLLVRVSAINGRSL